MKNLEEVANQSVQRALKEIWQDGYNEACYDMQEKNGWHDSTEKPEEGKTILVASIDPEFGGVDYYTLVVDYKNYSSLLPDDSDRWMYIFSPLYGK